MQIYSKIFVWSLELDFSVRFAKVLAVSCYSTHRFLLCNNAYLSVSTSTTTIDICSFVCFFLLFAFYLLAFLNIFIKRTNNLFKKKKSHSNIIFRTFPFCLQESNLILYNFVHFLLSPNITFRYFFLHKTPKHWVCSIWISKGQYCRPYIVLHSPNHTKYFICRCNVYLLSTIQRQPKPPTHFILITIHIWCDGIRSIVLENDEENNKKWCQITNAQPTSLLGS